MNIIVILTSLSSFQIKKSEFGGIIVSSSQNKQIIIKHSDQIIQTKFICIKIIYL